jgi:hypothetical protein
MIRTWTVFSLSGSEACHPDPRYIVRKRRAEGGNDRPERLAKPARGEFNNRPWVMHQINV